MDKTFVAVNDWCHTLLRDLTRRTPLVATTLDNGAEIVHYQIQPDLLPDSYYSLVGCHTLDGLPLEQLQLGCWRVREDSKPAVLRMAAGFDSTRLDRRCWGDLRVKPAGGRAALISAELLAFGTGMLRGPASRTGKHGAISTKLQTVHARIWALRREGSPGMAEVQKRVYESTNVIYGDALGELQQLWDRRADTEFLDRVAGALQDVHLWAQFPVSFHLPLNGAGIFAVHRRAQALWNAPPRSGRALLRRLEFILEHTIIESAGQAKPARRPICRSHPCTSRAPTDPRRGQWPFRGGAALN